MEARAKIPKTLEPLIVSEHALSRKSTAAISLSILKPLDVRNTKIYPKRELVGHTSSYQCSMPNSPAWEFEEFFKNETKRNRMRTKQYQNYLQVNYFETHAPPVLRGVPNSPLEYVAFGLQTDPFSSFILPLKIHLDEDEEVIANIICSLGTVERTGSKETVKVFNASHRRYTPRVFDARRMTDICYFRVNRLATGEKFEAGFPVEIRRIKLPWLAPRTGNAFKDKVTIVSKSFMRYQCLERMLDSLFVSFVQSNSQSCKFVFCVNQPSSAFSERFPAPLRYFSQAQLAQLNFTLQPAITCPQITSLWPTGIVVKPHADWKSNSFSTVSCSKYEQSTKSGRESANQLLKKTSLSSKDDSLCFTDV